MKQRLPTIFAIVVCLHRISSLHRKISQLESTVSNQHSDFISSVNDLYSNINTKLEEKASLLSASEWAYGELDPEQQTVLLLCSITPKEFSPSETSATLISGEQYYPMELQNDVFVATVPLPLFSEQNSWKVQFSDSGTLRTETLDWYLSPRYDYLPTLYADVNGSFNIKLKEGTCFLERDQTIHIDINANEPLRVRSATLIEVLDGKETKRTPIDIKPETTQEVLETNSMETEAAVSIDNSDDMHASYYYYNFLTDTSKIPFGSTLELYIEVVDSYNLHHRVLVDRQIISDTGDRIDDDEEWMWRGTEAAIYDADGNPLWEVHYN